MIVYRICQTEFSNDLSGFGARMYGGRWNKKGTPVVYTSETRSLCLLELAVHLPIPFASKNYSLVSIEVPDILALYQVSASELPQYWQTFPAPFSIQEYGDKLLKSDYPLIKTPSAIVPAEFNFLLNPAHNHFDQIKIVNIEPFRLDERLIKG